MAFTVIEKAAAGGALASGTTGLYQLWNYYNYDQQWLDETMKFVEGGYNPAVEERLLGLADASWAGALHAFEISGACLTVFLVSLALRNRGAIKGVFQRG